jgi:hypothetical protein
MFGNVQKMPAKVVVPKMTKQHKAVNAVNKNSKIDSAINMPPKNKDLHTSQQSLVMQSSTQNLIVLDTNLALAISEEQMSQFIESLPILPK